jgi:hypothetical protein
LSSVGFGCLSQNKSIRFQQRQLSGDIALVDKNNFGEPILADSWILADVDDVSVLVTIKPI